MFAPVIPLLLRPVSLLAALLVAAIAAAADIPKDLVDDPVVREELGVNEFTAPSISKIMADLEALKPSLPAGALDKTRLSPLPDNRFQLALGFGALLADGFLMVQAEQADGFTDVGRALLARASALGVDRELLRRSKALSELAEKRRWPALRKELGAAQREVENGLVRLRDEVIAHFIALGGWLRGLEAAAAAVEADYTPERAARLIRPDLLEYFITRLDETGLGGARGTALLRRVSGDLKSLHVLMRSGLTKEDLPRVREIVGELNAAVVSAKGGR